MGTSRILRWTAFPGVLAGILYLLLGVAHLFPLPNVNHPSTAWFVFGLIWVFSVALWLTGLYLLHRDTIRWTGFMGYASALAGHIIIGIWLYKADFNIIVAQKNFSLWVGLAIFLSAWGLMMFGTTLIHAERVPHWMIVCWAGGLIVGTTGIGGRWPGYLFLAAIGIIGCSFFIWRGPKKKTDVSGPKSTLIGNGQRLASLDILRGLIMIVMAIDHASFYILKTHSFEIWNLPVTRYVGNSGVFLTRFVTHFCAPGFFFLMGTGIILFAGSRKKQGWSNGKVMRHLVIRGTIIIALEKVLWTTILFGNLEFTKFGVLYALGGAMIASTLFLRFNSIILLCIGLAGMIVSQLIPQLFLNSGIYNHPLSILFAVPRSVGKWINIYPLLPWLSITLLGMVFGKELQKGQEKAYRKLLIAAISCLVLFVIVRGIGGFGNLRPPVGSHWTGFLSLIKYPPSLTFILLTLGVNGLLLILLEKFHHSFGNWKTPVAVFGKTALYFYFAHWFLYSTIGLPFYFIKGNLIWLYAGWAFGLLMLYPICRQYLEFKQKTAPDSIWRFI